MAHHVGAAQVDDGNSADAAQHAFGVDQTAQLAAGQVDLADVAGHHRLGAKADAGEKHLHLFDRGVLRFIQNHKGVVERAPAHEGQRRDLDLLALERFLHLVGAHQLVQRIVQRAQVGVNFLAQVAGQKTQLLTRFHCRAGQHDALHRAAFERVDRAGHRQIGLAGAGRANRKADVVRGHVFQVARLGRGAPAHFAASGLHAQCRHAGLGLRGIKAEHELYLFGRNRFARHFMQGLQHQQGLRGPGLGAFDAELLEAVRQFDLQCRLYAAQVGVQRTAQVAHAQVVGRGEGVSENQTDNPVKGMTQ